MKILAPLAIALAILALPTGRADDVASGAMSAEELKATIANLGYEVSDIGAGWQEIRIVHDRSDRTITFNLDLAVSGDSRHVWLVTYVAELPPLENLAPMPLAKLLAANDGLRPASFYIHESEGAAPRLYLSLTLANQGLRPVDLREAIDVMERSMARSVDLWTDVEWSIER